MTRKLGTLTAAVAAVAALVAPVAHAEWALNMTRGVTELSEEIYSLHMGILWGCTAIGVFVFGWMIVSMVRYRKSKGAVPDTAMVHNTKAEVIWTVIPVLILVAFAVPAAKTLVEIEDTTGSQLNVKITAYQWKWQYEYLDSGVSFFSTLARDSDAARQLESGVDVNQVENYLLAVDNPLVVPTGTKVRLLITAQDVIHAWWVPAFGMKKDAIPGYVNEMWFHVDDDKTGLYRGQCTELCGRDHGFMPIVVDVRSKADFESWLKTTAEAQKAAKAGSSQPATAAVTQPNAG